MNSKVKKIRWIKACYLLSFSLLYKSWQFTVKTSKETTGEIRFCKRHPKSQTRGYSRMHASSYMPFAVFQWRLIQTKVKERIIGKYKLLLLKLYTKRMVHSMSKFCCKPPLVVNATLARIYLALPTHSELIFNYSCPRVTLHTIWLQKWSIYASYLCLTLLRVLSTRIPLMKPKRYTSFDWHYLFII